MASAPAPRLLQMVADTGSEPAAYAAEVAATFGGAVFSVCPPPGQRLRTAWRQTLVRTQPTMVWVQELGAIHPDLLLDLRERSIPYAVFLHDFTPVCPTHQLWHRRQEPCSGPGAAKCAWCVTGRWRRTPEWALRTLRYRHRPRDWRTVLVRAEVLVTSSHFLREFWIEQGAPPERLAVIPPWLGLVPAPRAPLAAPFPQLFYAGDGSVAAGFDLLLEALELLRTPIQLAVTTRLTAAQQAGLKTALALRHRLTVAATDTAALSASNAAVVPARWQMSFSRVAAAAQALGAPVVATAVGGMPEAIIHGVNGYLAAPDNPHALAEALQESLQPQAQAWGGELVRQQALAAAGRSRTSLLRLMELMTSGATEPDVALALDHGTWLQTTAEAHAISVHTIAQAMVDAMRSEPVSMPAILENACQARISATGRRHGVDLNHAIAFFRACGCRRVAYWPENMPTDAESVARLAGWGLQKVACEDSPDGIFLQSGDATLPAWLRQRFPQARALVSFSPAGVETFAWG